MTTRTILDGHPHMRDERSAASLRNPRVDLAARRPLAGPARVGMVCVLLWLALPSRAQTLPPVQIWETNQVIPTYRVAPPDPNPRFYSGRTYQGAKATFYPYPVSDRLTDIREEKTYKVVFLENQFVRLSVLPELGGRIFSALDKGNNYDFFYRQHVIKPALIGMLGAWISGGVEWNVPHHHRASSFMPVDYTIESNRDGSKTLWVGETELRHRMHWVVGLTLFPDKSYVEMAVRLFNRTPFPNSFLFWINPAVHANDSYQVLFPPDVRFAVQHGKPEFVSWPTAHSAYGGVDYSRGVDISWWNSHPSPCSFFAWDSNEDFFGGYDHGKQAGVLHIANHHVVPGKKFFEWGNGSDGEMWSGILTDTDGPYLELMAGAYSDNQPDYSWCQPNEVKSWRHFWYPIRQMGGVKNANIDAAVNLTVTNGVIKLAFNTTADYAKANVRLEAGKKVILEKTIGIGPTNPFTADVPMPEGLKEEELRTSLSAETPRGGTATALTELVAYQPRPRQDTPIPTPVKRPAPPSDVKSIEDLYLTGLRIEQLYSPSFEAAPYYQEAIRRDPGDYRANTALGILYCKQWRFEEAEKLLRAAIERATQNYIRPKDGEAFYYLGVALRAQDKIDAARDAFYKAIWSAAWQGPGYHALAELDCMQGNYAQALESSARSLAAGGLNSQAASLKSALLRRFNKAAEAAQLIAAILSFDPLDFQAANELYLAQRELGRVDKANQALARLKELMRGQTQSCLEVAIDYANAGLWTEAMEVVRRQIDLAPDPERVFPMLHYYMGFFAEKAAFKEEAMNHFQAAARMPAAFCFPFRYEEVAILSRAMQQNPSDPRAPYYLGNLLYDNQPGNAIRAWERARALDSSFASVHRNLALGYSQTARDFTNAIVSLEKAIALNPKDPRFFFELDVLYEAAGTPVARRLEMLSGHHETVAERDDAVSREALLLTVAGQHDRAVEVVTQRRFHNWEGSSEAHSLYASVLIERGLAHFRAKRYPDALKDFTAALDYPANIEVGRPLHDANAARIFYHIGAVHEALGDPAKAREFYEKALEPREGGASELQYSQALALRKLGREEEARRICEGLVKAGEVRSSAAETPDYFAKFGERQSERARGAEGHYLTGLGRLGLGQTAEAKAAFLEALRENPSHLGATSAIASIAP